MWYCNRIVDETAASTTDSIMTHTTIFHVNSSDPIGSWNTSLAAMSEDPAVSIDDSLLVMKVSKADNQNPLLEAFGKVVDWYDANLLFHLIIASEAKADWYQVLKVKNIPSSVINLVQFDEFGNIIEDYNLHGLTLTSKEIFLLHFTQPQICY